MIFYKKRDFGELISDTLEFFKVYGKNFFKNYFAINGGLLVLLLVFMGVGYKDIVGQLFSSNLGGEAYFFEGYFDQNAGMLIFVSIIVVILIFTLSIANYSFPVLYMDAVARTKRNDFTVSEMFSMLKEKVGRMIIYVILSGIIFTPLVFLAFGISVLLILLIIGIFLVIAVIPVSVIIANITLFDFLTTPSQYFDSLGKAFRYTFSKGFWKYLGAVIILYIISTVIVVFFSLISGIIVGGLGFVSDYSDYDDNLFFLAMNIIVNLLSLLASLVLGNAMYILSGFIYYDSREDLQREVHFDEIDSIGKHV